MESAYINCANCIHQGWCPHVVTKNVAIKKLTDIIEKCNDVVRVRTIIECIYFTPQKQKDKIIDNN